MTYEGLAQTRATVERLAMEVAESPPDLAITFATGGMAFVIPLLMRLERSLQSTASWFDAHPFVMFPGLNWTETVNDKAPADIFSESFPMVLDLLVNGRVLLIDTVVGGGSMNRALTLLDEVLLQRKRGGAISIEVIGIIDGGKARRAGNGLRVQRADGSTLVVDAPHVVPVPHRVSEDEPIEGALPKSRGSIRMRYRTQCSLPLEDNTGAVGTDRFRHFVHGRHPEFASLPIRFRSGFTWVDVSESPLADRLFTLLAQDLSSASWSAMRALNERSVRSDYEARMYAEICRRTLLQGAGDSKNTATVVGAADGPILAADVAYF